MSITGLVIDWAGAASLGACAADEIGIKGICGWRNIPSSSRTRTQQGDLAEEVPIL